MDKKEVLSVEVLQWINEHPKEVSDLPIEKKVVIYYETKIIPARIQSAVKDAQTQTAEKIKAIQAKLCDKNCVYRPVFCKDMDKELQQLRQELTGGK